MIKRSPRHDVPNRPILVVQRSSVDTVIFPTIKHYCRFLHHLGEVKRRFKCCVLAYVVLPRSIWIILSPGADGVSKAAQSLFTSAAKTLRSGVRGGQGHVFSKQFESETLRSESDVSFAMRLMEDEARLETSQASTRWPFACVRGRRDRFGICKKQALKSRWHQVPGTYLSNHGRPTLRWYLAVFQEFYDFISLGANGELNPDEWFKMSGGGL